MLVRAIEELLYEAVRRHCRGAGDARRAVVELDTGAHKVDRNGPPCVRNRVGLPADLSRFSNLELAVAEFLEEDETPSTSGRFGRRAIVRR